MAEKNESAAGPMEREIVLTRLLDAPPSLVFQAWTDPIHMRKWWGPKAFTTPFCEMDVRPGGALRVVMRGPDGVEYPMTGVFQEIVEPERLVFTFVARDGNENPLLEGTTTVTFVGQNGKTKMTVQSRAVGLAPVAPQMLAGMETGWSQSLDRLADLAADATGRELVATRVFDAPRELVFRAWIEPEHLVQWWGPNSFTNTFHEFDPRPGGAWRFVMHGPDGVNYKNESVFVEIALPQRIVLDHVSWPRFRLTAVFEDLSGKTRLTFRQLFLSAADCDKVMGFAAEANKQNLERLAAQLAKMA